MKIGILTFYYNNKNYGGLLQAYALQYFLMSKGYECEQICWDFGAALLQHEDVSSLRKTIEQRIQSHNFLYKVEKRILHMAMMDKLTVREGSFKVFEKEIPHSEKVYTVDNYSQIAQEYDVVVVGSDQIWNMAWYCPEHFLNFTGSTVKISYAASMPNCELNDSQRKTVADHLRSFSAISVREKNTQQFLEEITKKKISWMPDPTLLLTHDEWENVMSVKRESVTEPYIFCYFLGGGARKRDKAVSIARKTGRKIVVLPHLTDVRPEDAFFGDVKLYDVSPRDFIGLISNAELIMTDSFHATVFSIIFQRSFVTFSREENDKGNSRIGTLLAELGLEDHIVPNDAEDCLVHEIASRTIEDKSEKLVEFRNRAGVFFDDILKGTKQQSNED